MPLEGAWRKVLLDDGWFVIGHNAVVPCGSERAAQSMLEELAEQTDVDRLALQAIEDLDAQIDPADPDLFAEAER